MITLVIALDGGHTITNPDSNTLARLAYQRHLTECRTCAHGPEHCPTGTARHTATRATTDFPNYPEI